MDPWDQIKTDREAFADYLEALPPEDWAKPSLCDGWSVKGVASHLLVSPTMSKGRIFVAFARAGFNLDKFSARMIDEMDAGMSTDQIVETTRDTADVQNTPPGLKPPGILAELAVHSSDVSLALDRPFDLPVGHYVMALDHLKGVQPVLGSKKRIAGLTVKATDADWTTGDGPLVEGPAKLLVLAMTGRPVAFDSLTGDGVDTMRAR